MVPGSENGSAQSQPAQVGHARLVFNKTVTFFCPTLYFLAKSRSEMGPQFLSEDNIKKLLNRALQQLFNKISFSYLFSLLVTNFVKLEVKWGPMPLLVLSKPISIARPKR